MKSFRSKLTSSECALTVPTRISSPSRLLNVLVVDARFVPVKDNKTYHPGRCADIYAGDVKLGTVGELHPAVTEAYDISCRVYCAELNIPKLFEARGEERKYKPLPKYPSTSRDLSLVCDDEVTSDEIIDIIRKNAKHLESVSIFDMYKGEQSFYSEVLRGMQDAAYMQGYDVLIATTRDDPEHEMHLLGMLFSKAVDGAVLLAPKLDSRTISELAKKYQLAMCLERLEDCNILCVTIDNERAGYDATKYLIDKGRRRIGLLTTEVRSQSSIDREKGYRRALQEAGIPLDENLIYYGGYDADSGTRGCEKLMNQPRRPDAIFSISDTISIGAMTYALNNGITVGKDVLFFGFDNIAYSHMFIPHLTTVEQPCYLQGKTVIEKLIHNIKSEDKDTGTYKLPHRLIPRESTGDKSI